MIAVLLCLLLSLYGPPALADPPPPGSVIVPIDQRERTVAAFKAANKVRS